MDLFKLLGTIAIDNANANKEIDKTTGKASNSSSIMSAAFKTIGAAVATYFTVDAIVDFGKACVETAASVQAQKAQFESAFGDMSDSANKVFASVGAETGIFASRLQTEGTKAFSMFKGAGMEASAALEETETFLRLAADAAAYYDISLEDASARVLGFAKGNFENGDAIGVFTNEAQRNSTAMEQYGKKYSECTEAQKQMMALDMISHTYELSGALGQASREADGYENVTGNLKEAWRQLQAVIGSPILQAVIPIIRSCTASLQPLTGWVQKAITWCGEHKTILSLGAALAMLGTPMAATGGALMFLITAVTSAYNELDGFKNIVDKVKNGVFAGFSVISNAASQVKDELLKAWNGITARCEPLISLIQDNLAGAFEDLEAAGESVSEKLEALKEKFQPVADLLSGAFAASLSDASGWFEDLQTKAGDLAEGALKKLNAGVSKARELFDTFSQKATKLWEQLDPLITMIRDNLLNSLKNLEEPIGTIKASFAEVGQTIEEDVLPALRDSLLPLWDKLKPALMVVVGIVGGALAVAFAQAAGFINGVVSALSGFVTMISGVIQAVSGAFRLIVGIFTGNKDLCVGAMEDLKSGVTKIFGGLWDAVSGFVKGFTDGVQGFFSALFRAVGLDIVPQTVVEVVRGFKDMWSSVTSVVTNLKNNVAGIFDTVKTKVTSVTDNIRDKVTGVWNSIASVTSSIFGKVRDTISSAVSTAYSTVSGKFGAIKTAISDKINAARDAVKTAIDKIRGFFNFSWSLPKLKMPHVSIQGEFSISPPSVPTFGVSWYKKAMNNAMLLNRPTIFGYSAASGNYLGGGDAGSEVVAGSQTLMGMIRAAAAEQNEAIVYYLQKLIQMLAEQFPQMLEALDRDVVLDSGEVVGALAAPMDKALGRIRNKKERGG